MSLLASDDRKHFPNPFGQFVGDPLEDGVDVSEINQQAFEACQKLIEDVRAQHTSGALTLLGDAGTGKTHILGRVRRWLQTEPGSLFIPVRLDTNARMLWRHLRRNMADALLRTDAAGQRALNGLLKANAKAIEECPERDLAIIVRNLLDGRHVRDSAAWLRGQELPESALSRLDVGQPGVDEDQEVSSRNLVCSLCRLIEPGVIVFCLDQWEALQDFAGDKDGLFATGKAVSFLHDPPIRNACIICCVQSGFVQTLERGLDIAIQQRLLGRRQAIRQIDWNQGQQLIAARLNKVPELAQLRRHEPDPLWPLLESPIRNVFTANLAPARKVISACKDLFDLWRNTPSPQETPDDILKRELEKRIEVVEPADAEAALRNGLPVVLPSIVRAKDPFDFSLRDGKQLIAICNQDHGGRLHARLKKIDEASKPDGVGVLLLRDARIPIRPTARLATQRLRSLQEKNARLIPVSQEAVELLAALRRLLDDARSRDLADRSGDPIPVTKVEQWIASHLPGSVESFLSELDEPDLFSAKLADLVAQRKVLSLEDAARELGSRAIEVESCAGRHPGLFGILQGSTPVIFQVLEAESPQAE